MAFRSKDGQEFSNPHMARHNDYRIDAGKIPGKPAVDEQKDITSDPEAMECVNKLKELGYSADDVAEAMEGEQPNAGAEATKAAGMQMPQIGR